jgi:capsule polysaccharide export protein KpsE/RkpR
MSGIISISVTDTDPKRARDLAAAYVEELNNLVNQLSTSSARREREFLEGRLKEVKKNLDDATRELSQFSSSNATLDVQDQGKVMLTAAADVQGELIAAESELRGLQSIYGVDNVRVRAVEGRIAELRSQLEKMSGSKGTADSDLSSDQLYPSLRQLPRLGATYYDLYRQTKIQETVYEVLTNEYPRSQSSRYSGCAGKEIIPSANPYRDRRYFCRVSLGCCADTGCRCVDQTRCGSSAQGFGQPHVAEQEVLEA